MENSSFKQKLLDFILVTIKSRAFWISFIGLLTTIFLALQDYYAWAGIAGVITQAIASYFRFNPSGSSLNYINLASSKKL